MFVDYLVYAAADDELVSVGGKPRLDETVVPVRRAKRISMRRAACSWS